MPNALLELLSLLPDAECRVLLVIARKTIGWQKACDVISVSQLVTATGMVKQGVLNGLKAAMKRGILKRSPSGFNNGYCYEIDHDQVVHEVDHLKQSTKQTTERSSSPRSRPLVVHEVDHLGPSSGPRSRPTKERVLKKEKEKIRAPRKSADAPIEKTPHQNIMDAYANALGYPIRDGPKEGNAAKWLVNNGYSPEQVTACYAHLKVQTFWKEKHISLQTVAGNIGAYLQAKNGHRNGRSVRPNIGQDTERAQWTAADLDAEL